MRFSDILKKRKAITVELNPPKGTNTRDSVQEIARIKKYIDAVNITDSPLAKMRMSPIALSCIIHQRLKVETIFNLTCRDRNILGLQAELLGASALGVENILAIYGDPPDIGDHPGARPIYEVDTIGLIRLAARLNEGFDQAGNQLEQPANFFIGAAANPAAADLRKEISRLREKAGAGAGFFLSQPVYEVEILKKYRAAASGLNIPLIVGIMPLKSLKFARYLNEKVPGIIIPQKFMEILEKTPVEKQKETGLQLAEEFIQQAAPLAAGFHFMTGGKPADFIELLKNAHHRLKAAG